MEIGFNDDVEYNDVTFHIQTEDHGQDDAKVSTQLFTGGRILDNQTVNYGHLLEGIADDEERRQKVRKVMIAAHRNVYKRLLSGEYDEPMGFDVSPSMDEGSVSQEVESFTPSQSRVPETAQVVEEDGRVTFTFETGEAIDLKSLRQQLNEVDLFPKGDGEAALFEDLGDFDMEGVEEGGAELVSHATVATAPVFPMAAPPALPKFAPTGRRAFQGLLEPPHSSQMLDMVLGFLAASQPQ